MQNYFSSLRDRKRTGGNYIKSLRGGDQEKAPKEKEIPQIDADLNGVLQQAFEKFIDHLKSVKEELRPKKGVDYFTKDEVDRIVRMVTPKKGVHYRDGHEGPMGPAGRDGKDADVEAIISMILERLPQPKDGKDGAAGRDGKDADHSKIIAEVRAFVEDFFGGRKLSIRDVEGLEDELTSIRSRKHGGQGKTYSLTVGSGVTTADDQTYTFKSPPLASELFVIRGGAWIFEENGDYTVTVAPGGRVAAITLTTPLNVAAGETINFKTKG